RIDHIHKTALRIHSDGGGAIASGNWRRNGLQASAGLIDRKRRDLIGGQTCDVGKSSGRVHADRRQTQGNRSCTEQTQGSGAIDSIDGYIAGIEVGDISEVARRVEEEFDRGSVGRNTATETSEHAGSRVDRKTGNVVGVLVDYIEN